MPDRVVYCFLGDAVEMRRQIAIVQVERRFAFKYAADVKQFLDFAGPMFEGSS